MNNNLTIGKITGRTVQYFFKILFAFIFAFPFYYIFVLSTHENIFSSVPHMWFGGDFGVNLARLNERYPEFWRAFFNSAGVAVTATAATIFFCSMAGFAFAKYNFKGKNQIFTFILLTLLIPPFLHIIPTFQLMITFGWVGTWLPLVVPAMANSMGIFLMTQFMRDSIPNDLLDAARIDGLNEFNIFLRVGLPLAKPGIAVLGTITFIGSWNNFLGALVMMPSMRNTTLPVILSSMTVQTENNFGALMAGTALSILPLLIAYVVFSRQIIANLAAGSVKG